MIWTITSHIDISEHWLDVLEQGCPIQSCESPQTVGLPSYQLDNSFHLEPPGRQLLSPG